MKTRRSTIGAACAVLLALASGEAGAAPILRVQVDQRGDFVLLGNTLGQDCSGAALQQAPLVGTVGNCGTLGIPETAPDVFWRADSPLAGQAEANSSILAAQARSTSMLVLPANASITHAFLYWGARLPAAGADTTVTLDRQGGFSAAINALTSYQLSIPQPGNTSADFYQSVADVTSLVQDNGPGAYRVGGVDSLNLVDLDSSVNFTGWWMAVFYSLPSEPPRNLALFEGLDVVSPATFQTTNLSGFVVPNAGFDAKLGVAAYEGDDAAVGDEFYFGDLVNPLGDLINPSNNFFNSSRSVLASPIHHLGDLPELTGAPGSMSGLDLDVVNVHDKLSFGQTSAQIKANSTGDVYYLAGFVTSISTLAPDFATSTKVAAHGNGGALLAGDTIDYTIVVPNTGNDTSIHTVLTDVLPPGITYVPGSLQVTAGANPGVKTDVAGDDQGEYNVGTRTVTVRLGNTADAAVGGTLLPGESTTVTFKVTVDAGFSGTILNQAKITAAGELGAPVTNTLTDGNGASPGAPPTVVVVDGCASNADCDIPTPLCFTAPTPNICVQCIVDADCLGAAASCDPVLHTCDCEPTGAEICDGIDNDCNGVADEGNPGGGAICVTGFPGPCSAGVLACAAGGVLACVPNVLPGALAESCNDVDDDCDGVVDDGLGVGSVCSMGLGVCQASGILLCDGQGGVECNAEVSEPSPETCNNLDDDCDGTIDDGLGLGSACSAGVGACQSSGVLACDGAGGVLCTAVPGQATPETCNNIDDDCDGAIDDGLGLGDACSVGVGACVASGVLVCGAGGATTCDATAGEPSAEVCDGVDNDCNGEVDDGDPEGGVACTTDLLGVCAAGTTACTAGGVACNPNVVPGAQEEICGDDLDSDCDGDPSNGCGCAVDSECGDETSGKVCDDATHTCIDGCRGAGGTGCPGGEECTSSDRSIGQCIQRPECSADSDCGGPASGRICEGSVCINGCRGAGGNTCPVDGICSSTTTAAGTCSLAPLADDLYPEGTGIFCATRPGSGDSAPVSWIAGLMLSFGLAARRRRRA